MNLKLHGGWVPALPPWLRVLVVSLIPFGSIVVGSDYLSAAASPSLTIVERALPLDAWGWLLVSNGLVALAGFAFGRRRIAVYGLVWTAALMTSLGVGIGWQTITQSGTWRGASLYLLAALIGWALAAGYAFGGGGRGRQ